MGKQGPVQEQEVGFRRGRNIRYTNFYNSTYFPGESNAAQKASGAAACILETCPRRVARPLWFTVRAAFYSPEKNSDLN